MKRRQRLAREFARDRPDSNYAMECYEAGYLHGIEEGAKFMEYGARVAAYYSRDTIRSESFQRDQANLAENLICAAISLRGFPDQDESDLINTDIRLEKPADAEGEG